MGENLVHYISKLSATIVAQHLESDKNVKRFSERFFESSVKKLKTKGFDILLKKSDGTPISDPCLTDYGGNWSPVTLLTDYGRELKSQGAGKANDKLVNCISLLMEKDYYCINDLLKLLLVLKKPLDKEPLPNFQSDLSFSGSELLHGMDSLSAVSETLSNEVLPESFLFRKGFYYEEIWAKHFDSRFHILGGFSKRNLLSSEKLSLTSFKRSKSPLSSPNESHASFFTFTGFFQEKKEKNDKSLFDIYIYNSKNENPLLDSFVDNPIRHKLPSPSINLRLSGTEESPEWLNLNPEEGGLNAGEDDMKESDVIELKRDSNCSHSFSILYKKSINSEQCFESNSACCLKNKKKDDLKNESGLRDSKEIVLGLWEQEVSLIKDFKPELASDFPELRMISTREYVDNVKYMLTGINSGTFQLDPHSNKFKMVFGTCLNDVTPESLMYFSKDFVEIGNCYAELNIRMADFGNNSFDTCTTISQAFWKSIFDYLELHYSLVLDIPSTINLMSLKSCMRDVHDMITTVARICRTDQPKEDLFVGGQLLTYLIQIAEQTCRDCVSNIVFGILKNCCNIYYVCILQKWMFKGELDSTNNEFFVDYRREKIKMKSRAYYNSFYIIEEKIPNFLLGLQETIYNCGKSIHFLKLFNPQDEFCQILNKVDYPTMRLCFSEEQLEKLEKDFKNYEKQVLDLCGGKITIKTIKEEEKEKEKAYLESIREFRKIEEKKREEALKKKIEAEKVKKEKQNQELNEQKNLIEANKNNKKEKEQEEELRFMEETKKANLILENLINQEKSHLKRHYSSLIEDIDRRIIVANTRKEILTETLNEINETLNNNQIQTDKEGNLTNEIDINSNRDEKKSEDLFWEKKNEFKTPEKEENLPTGHFDEFDENSNPSLKNRDKFPGVFQNISYRTSAAEEAQKNKRKVLGSEFELSSIKLRSPKKKVNSQMSVLEKNKRKVLKSEYNISLESEIFADSSLKSVTRESEHIKGNNLKLKLPETDSDSLQNMLFSSVELESKPECSNLTLSLGLSSKKSESIDSFMTSQTDASSENVSSEPEGAVTEDFTTSSKNSLLLNEKYQTALVRDMEIALTRLSEQDIFCTLKEEELDNLPCTNFSMFQRFLKKSIMIPLRVQEKLANNALLRHLLKGENLLSHLNSLRGYFFLNDGEFGRSFTHHTFRSLAKCTNSKQFFEKSNLNNIVNEALNYTIHNFEPNAQNLSFRIVKMPPFLNHSSHDVLSPFELTYKVDWPLNIILTDKALYKYKMVFKFLLKFKRISWTLNENFLYLNSQFKSKRLNGKILVESSHFHKIQIFRHAMTQVVITLDDYIFSNGVQLPWIFFLKDLETTENIDDLYEKHVRYIKDVLQRCFLSKNSEDLLECIHSMIELALKFHYTAKSSGMTFLNGTYVHPKFLVLKSTFNEFCFVLKTFLKTLKEKISSDKVIKAHYVLIEKFDQKLT